MRSYPIIKGRKIRIGLVGCGRIAKKHFDSIATYPDEFELVSGFDDSSRELQYKPEWLI